MEDKAKDIHKKVEGEIPEREVRDAMNNGYGNLARAIRPLNQFGAPNSLLNGTRVKVEAVVTPENPARRSLLERFGDVVGMVKGLPPDASKNVNHSLYGHPKK